MSISAPPGLPDAEARLARLRPVLIAELDRPAPRPRGRRRVALAAVAAAVAVAVPLALVPGDPAPALAVEHDGGWLVLRIADVAAGEDALTRELRDSGIRGEVRLLPVPPENVGTWAIISEHADPPGTPRPRRLPSPPPPIEKETVRLDRVQYERETLRIPVAEVRESTGYFVFYAGREARAGEELWRDGDSTFRP